MEEMIMVLILENYKMSTCYAAILQVIIGTLFAIMSCRGIIINMRNAKSNFRYLIVSFVSLITVIALFVFPSIMSLSNGGIYMLVEKEEDAIVLEGEIETIVYPSKRVPNHKYAYTEESSNSGMDITINGETYFMPHILGFKEGDEVIISYLPKSKFILSIYHAEEAQ